MVLIEDIKNYLNQFEKDILQLLLIFEKQYGFKNVVKLHWSGQIPKVNYLENGVEFYVHGGGCTAELDGKDISFEMDGNGNFSYDPFKFMLYLETLNLKLDHTYLTEIFNQLLNEGFLNNDYRIREENSLSPMQEELDYCLDLVNQGLEYDQIRSLLTAKQYEKEKISIIMYEVDKAIYKRLALKLNRRRGKSLMAIGLIFFALGLGFTIYTLFASMSVAIISIGAILGGISTFLIGNTMLDKSNFRMSILNKLR